MSKLTLKGLHHVAIHVHDIEESEKFYERCLGLSPIATPEDIKAKGIRWYDLPDGRQFHLFEKQVEIPISRAHFALEVEDADSWRENLKSKGIEIDEPTVDLYSAKRFFVRDPSGNLFELVQWLP